jgi:ATP-dependent DNA ligase
MLIERLRKRLAADRRASFIEALPAVARRQAPVDSNWIHEIKHDGYWMTAGGTTCK